MFRRGLSIQQNLSFQISLIPDPGVNHGVNKINPQIDQHIGAREHHDHPLDDRVVAVADRIHRQPPKPGMLNTVSVITTPLISSATPMPITVTIGTPAFFNA